MPRKADAEEILEHKRQLPSSLRLGRNRHFWAHWLFRSDHVENAANILNSGKLLSRAAAEAERGIRVDSGSLQYVGRLSAHHRKLVRLYFRPRTPTQYRNEGIRPQGKIEYDAHMPVPVYLLFDVSLLGEAGVRFTKGRLAEGTEIGDSAEFLKSMAFADVYHDAGVGRLGGSSRRSEILNARHSEVVENELPLNKLTHIICRSAAERETLLSLLSDDVRDRWLKSIHVDEGRRRMFEKRATFVRQVELSNDKSGFHFYSNIDSDMRGPFELAIEWSAGNRTARAGMDGFTVSDSPVAYPLNPPAPRYRVRVTLDGNLAYQGHFDERHESELLF